MDRVLGTVDNGRAYVNGTDWSDRIAFGDRNVSNRLGLVSGIIDVVGDNRVGWSRQTHNNQAENQPYIGNVSYEDGSTSTVDSARLRAAVFNRAICQLVLP